MAKKISSLSVVLGATVAPFTKAFRGAGSAVTSLQGKLKSVGSSILKFTGIAGGLGAVLGGAGLSVGIKRQMAAIDASAKLADRLGLATESLAGLNHAAELSGVSQETLTGSLEKMLNTVGEAVGGSKSATTALDRLGLSADRLAGMSADQQLAAIADGLNSIASPAERAAAAQDIFGRSGQQLLPMLAEGSAGLAELQREAEKLGLTFSRTDAAKIEEANDAITRMGSVGTGMFRSLAVAAAPFLTQAAGWMTDFGAKVTGVFQRIVPVAIGWLQRLWAGVSTVFNAIWGFVSPIVSAIGDFIARNWEATVGATTAYLMSMWNVVKSVFGVAWSIVQGVGNAIASAWAWAMQMLGFSTEETGASVGGIFQKLHKLGRWLMDKITFAFNAIAFAITNWRDTLDLMVIKATYSLVKFANEAVHFFSEVIPGVLSWFLDNWKDIFTTIGSFTAALFTNMYKNVTGFFKGVWSWLKGDGFDFKWTSLTEGFESTIKELPQIAEREIGPLEQALADEADRLGGSYAERFQQFMDERSTAAKDAADSIADTFKGIGRELTLPEIEGIGTPESPAQMMIDDIEGVGEAAKATSNQLQALFGGSAESERARFAARFASGSSSTAANPTAAPLPASTTRAMRENAGSETALKQLVELIRTGTNRTLTEIRDGVREGGLATASI